MSVLLSSVMPRSMNALVANTCFEPGELMRACVSQTYMQMSCSARRCTAVFLAINDISGQERISILIESKSLGRLRNTRI